MKKVIACFLLAGTVTGAGSVLASSTANNVLDTWYGQAFKQEENLLLNQATRNEIVSSIDIAEETKIQIKQSLLDVQESEVSGTKTAIVQHKERYIQDLNATKNSLIQQNKLELEALKEALINQHEQELDQEVEQLVEAFITNEK